MSPVLTFLGGARTVTGSKFLLESEQSSLLVDCGLFQGQKELRLRNWEAFPVDAAGIGAVLLTHAHLDHVGFLPRLVAEGFAGPVHASPGTVALARIVLPDSAFLQEEEAKYANKKGYSKHRPALPLYTAADAERAMALLSTLHPGSLREVAPGITALQRPAGHILGSSISRVEVGGATVTFSGDLGRNHHPLLLPPAPIGDSDFVVVESTYGDRDHDDEHAILDLRDAIRRTVDRGGTVVIPAFAVDRTEVLLHHLGHLDDQGELPDVPIYVDSPMALAALRVYHEAILARSPEMRPELFHDPTPFLSHRVIEVHEPEESKRVTASDEPKVIVSASGMAAGGRVVHHLAKFLTDPNSSVVLVGFQAAGTRGRSLAEGATELKMLGRYVRVRAEVVNMPMFSVHADADELVAWVATCTSEPRGVFCVHGEEQAATALARRIDDELGWPGIVPHHGERVLL